MGPPGADTKSREMLQRSRADTDPEHGTRPRDRTIQEHLRMGAINLDKPAGPTSHQVIAWLKQGLHLEKAGHGGTLDPNVTGVLPVALQDGTRVIKTLLEAPKEYVAVCELHGDVNEDRYRDAILTFRGPVYQLPPLKSAVKRELRVRTIYDLEILEIRGRLALFRVSCEAGTYIRKLCTDIGTLLGTTGHMRDLRRTRTGPFHEDACVTLHDVRDAYEVWRETGDETQLRQTVQPIENLVAHLPRVVVRDSAVDAVCHGAALAVPGVVQAQADTAKGDLVALFTLKGELVATGHAQMTGSEMVKEESGFAVKPNRVVMNVDTYPKTWGKRAA